LRKAISCGLVALQLCVALTANARQSLPVNNTSADSLAACSEKLIPYADWPKVKDPRFALDVSGKSGGRLSYFGAEHLTDPTHAQFAEIERAWNALKPTVAYYEGPNRPIAETKDETIRQAGESGFVRFLAKRDGVPFVSLEPSPADEAAYVMRKFPSEQVLLFYVLRETARLRERRKLPEAELKAAVAQLLERVAKMKGFEGAFTDVNGLETAYRKYWTSPANWWEAPQAWFAPGKSSRETGGVFTNDINTRSSEYRDLHMYRSLAGATLEDKRVFAVVGRNHVPMQSPALRCAIK
jgi:hypothetical protein